jgi:hypothetical protein
MLKEMREALKAMAAPPNMAATSADRNFMGGCHTKPIWGQPNQTKMEESNQIKISKVTEVIPDEAVKLNKSKM